MTEGTRSTGPLPQTAITSTWAVLAKERVTWRQVTEGWAVLAVLGALGLAAGALLKVARLLARPQD